MKKYVEGLFAASEGMNGIDIAIIFALILAAYWVQGWWCGRRKR